MKTPCISFNAGFTLIELVIVIILLGIISIVAFPRTFSTETASARMYATDVLLSLSYAKHLSQINQCPSRWVYSASGYLIEQPDKSTNKFPAVDCNDSSATINYKTAINPNTNLPYSEITAPKNVAITVECSPTSCQSNDTIQFNTDNTLTPENTDFIIKITTQTPNAEKNYQWTIKLHSKTGLATLDETATPI